MEGIRRFAGDDPERARYYPEDARFLEALAPRVEHFDVVAENGTPAARADAEDLARELATPAHGDTWHGPALGELLEGVSAQTAAAWTGAKEALFEAHRALTARVARLSAADLRAPVPGRPYDAHFEVRSAIRHAVYHSGQIGLLRKGTPAP